MSREDLHAIKILLQFLDVALLLGPAILEPGDHLGVGQAQGGGDLITISWRQVLLVQEALLQLKDLVIGEGGARFALFFRLRTVREDVQVGFI